MKILFVDTETTGVIQRDDTQVGFKRWTPRMLELAYVLYDYSDDLFTPIKRFCSDVKYDGHISAEAAEVNGFTEERARAGRPLRDVLDEFIADANNALMVGHNYHEFDRIILDSELRHAGHSWWADIICSPDKPYIDTMFLARAVIPTAGPLEPDGKRYQQRLGRKGTYHKQVDGGPDGKAWAVDDYTGAEKRFERWYPWHMQPMGRSTPPRGGLVNPMVLDKSASKTLYPHGYVWNTIERTWYRIKDPIYKFMNIQKLHQQLLGKPFDGAHTALADVEATARCFIEMVELMRHPSIQELDRLQREGPKCTS